MRVGFLNNQIDNRGTGNAVFDYAQYNEAILDNSSRIYTFPFGSHDREMVKQFQYRFKDIYNIFEFNSKDVDVLYHIKSGHDDNFRVSVPYLVHSVFENHPHGDKYATISPWMGERFGLLYVPHIISLPDINNNLRFAYNIPDSAIVFGRHGGPDSFDIPFVWKAIQRVSEKENVWFLFMNTNRPDIELNSQVIFIEPTVDRAMKRMFINTCDAMIHARARGETFGIAVGEFASMGKPVITYGKSPEMNHYFELKDYGIYYNDEEELISILEDFTPRILPSLYNYSPTLVMQNFKEVFLDGFDTRNPDRITPSG